MTLVDLEKELETIERTKNELKARLERARQGFLRRQEPRTPSKAERMAEVHRKAKAWDRLADREPEVARKYLD